jgi:hypothetical protein
VQDIARDRGAPADVLGELVEEAPRRCLLLRTPSAA